MFLSDNEHIIIMDQGFSILTRDELVMLADAGIQTVYCQGYVDWDDVQSGPGEPFNFSILDDYMDDASYADLKVMLGVFHRMPTWKPDSWYLRREKLGIMSYSDPDAAADIDELITALIERYQNVPCHVVYAMPQDGEFPFHFWPRNNPPPIPIEHATNFIVERQRLLEAQHGEVWTAFHHSCFPPHMEPIYSALHEAFPNSRHYAIHFTHWPHPANVQSAALTFRTRYGLTYYVGSEYADGLKDFTDRAIGQNVKFITCPTHTFQPQQERHRIEPWMLDNIRWSLARFQEKCRA